MSGLRKIVGLIGLLPILVLSLLASPVWSETKLNLIGTYMAPDNIAGTQTRFGGISGLDYDSLRKRWVMISDDRSEFGPARIYRAWFDYDAHGVKGLSRVEATPLHMENGAKFAVATVGTEVADGEAIRIDPLTQSLIWSSEGDPKHGIDPKLRRINHYGYVTGHIPLPDFLRFDNAATKGPRSNLTTEGVSFGSDGQSLWVSLEGPLIEDGPIATIGKGALTRIMHLSRKGGVLGVYAYPVEPIPAQKAGMKADNGISEILMKDANRMWVLERAGEETAKEIYRFYTRLYEVDLTEAKPTSTNLLDPGVLPLTKRLILDFETLLKPNGGPLNWVDNIEGMSFGPRLKDGVQTVVFVSDNNFSSDHMTQFLVFTVTD